VLVTLGLKHPILLPHCMACVIHTLLAIGNTQRAAADFALPGKPIPDCRESCRL